MPRDTQKAFKFGPFRLEINDHLLLRNDKVIPLTPKAFKVLVCLLHRGGHLVEREALMCEVWPDSLVEEATIAGYKDDYPIGWLARQLDVIVFRRFVSPNGKARRGH
jgi:hypothetical protein